jgi:hypothetical protein
MNKTLLYSHCDGLDELKGQTFTKVWINEMATIDKKIKWISAARRFSLAARLEIQPRGWEVGVNEKDMEPIQEWCQQNRCGRRISFDTFQFKNKAQITMFLLRWAS